MKGITQVRIIGKAVLLASFAGLTLFLSPGVRAQPQSGSDELFRAPVWYGEDYCDNSNNHAPEDVGSGPGAWSEARSDPNQVT